MAKKYIDLTVPLTAGMTMHDTPLYFGVPGVSEIKRIASPDMPESGGISSTWLSHAAHHGSHIDAQEHQVPWGQQIHEYPVDSFIGDALVIDIDPNKRITAEDMERIYGGKIKGVKMLLFRVKSEPGADQTHGQPRVGGLTADAIEWCAKHGIKAMNSEGVVPGSFRVQLQNNIVNFHYLQNLEKITKERVFLIALPQLIIPTEAAPIRIVAVEDDDYEVWKD